MGIVSKLAESRLLNQFVEMVKITYTWIRYHDFNSDYVLFKSSAR